MLANVFPDYPEFVEVLWQVLSEPFVAGSIVVALLAVELFLLVEARSAE